MKLEKRLGSGLEREIIIGVRWNVPKLPQPWEAKTAVIMRPRIFVEANSEEMTALKGQSPATPTPIGGWIEMIKEEKDVVLRGSARQIKYQ